MEFSERFFIKFLYIKESYVSKKKKRFKYIFIFIFLHIFNIEFELILHNVKINYNNKIQLFYIIFFL